MNNIHFDVCIAGGGPAGCIAARLLAQHGLSILIVNRENSRVHKFGETLPSAAIRLIKKIGLYDVAETLDQYSVTDIVNVEHINGQINFWGSNTPYYIDGIIDPYGSSLRIERHIFDNLLQSTAVSAGVKVYNSEVVDLKKQNDKTWGVTLSNREVINVKFLIDATGKSSKLARLLNVGKNRGKPLVALYRLFQPEKNSDLQRTIVSSCPNGWLYMGKINHQQWVMGFHTLPSHARKILSDVKNWDEILKNNLSISEIFGNMQFDNEVYSHNARSEYLEKFSGDSWFACGDAAISFDPLAGQGLFNAIYSAKIAVDAIVGSLNCDKECYKKYDQALEKVRFTYEKKVTETYHQESRWTEQPFWKMQHN